MKDGTTRRSLLPATMTCVVALGLSASALGQAGPAMEGITVTGERALTIDKPTGVVEQELRVSKTVNHADLDLATGSGEKALESRITLAADEVCTELDKLLPARTMEHGNCVRETVARAMADVRKRYALR